MEGGPLRCAIRVRNTWRSTCLCWTSTTSRAPLGTLASVGELDRNLGCNVPGKHTKNDGKSQFSMGKSTISMFSMGKSTISMFTRGYGWVQLPASPNSSMIPWGSSGCVRHPIIGWLSIGRGFYYPIVHWTCHHPWAANPVSKQFGQLVHFFYYNVGPPSYKLV